MMVTGSTYSLARATGTCAATGREMRPGEHFMATLLAGPKDWLRIDLSLEAWQRGDRPLTHAPPGCRVFASWRSTFHPHEPSARKQAIGDDELLDMFESMQAEEPGAGDGTDAAHLKQLRFRFILGLLLVRRRLLRVIGQKRTRQGTVMQVLRRGQSIQDVHEGMAPMELVDPGLDEASITEAMEQLLQLTGGDDADAGVPTSSASSPPAQASHPAP